MPKTEHPPHAGRIVGPAIARPAGLPWPAMLALLVLFCWAGWWIPLNNDVSWQYWIARQVRSGVPLYRDIVEVNPPLWFWEAIPISGLADLLRFDAGHAAVCFVMLRVVLALRLTAGLIQGESQRRVAMLLAGLLVLLCLLPLHDFAEREHLMLIGALPTRYCSHAAEVHRRFRQGWRSVPGSLPLTALR